jgi:transcriptional regulator of arginine metabolism
VRILREGRAHSQQDIVEALRGAGHDVTQATVSRDLHDVGATKLRVNGEFVYRLSDDVARSVTADLLARNIDRTFAEFTLDVRTAHSLVVLVTAPGHAAAVARALDHSADIEHVVGTIAGDDTIFVATPSPEVAEDLARRWTLAVGIRTEVPV